MFVKDFVENQRPICSEILGYLKAKYTTYASRLAVFQKKADFQIFVPNPNTMFAKSLPFLLKPGNCRMGGIDQKNLKEGIEEKGIEKICFLYCDVNDLSKSKPTLVRVKLK